MGLLYLSDLKSSYPFSSNDHEYFEVFSLSSQLNNS